MSKPRKRSRIPDTAVVRVMADPIWRDEYAEKIDPQSSEEKSNVWKRDDTGDKNEDDSTEGTFFL